MVASTRRSARIAVAPPKEAPPAKPVKAAPKKAPPKKAAAAVTKAKPKATKDPSPKSKAATKKKVATDSKKKTSLSKKSSADKPSVTKKESMSPKTVVTVEACKSWNAFKTRAIKIVKAVGDRALVEINKEKPGKGNFVVTIDGIEEPIVSLLGMKRPFPALKSLDMIEISRKILEQLE